MRFVFWILGAGVLTLVPCAVLADTATSSPQNIQQQIDVNDQAVSQLNQEIATYESEIKQADSDKQTLQNSISTLNLQSKDIQAQVTLTQKQVNVTELQIQQLGTGITNTKRDIQLSEQSLAEDLRSLQQIDSEPLSVQLLSSDDLASAWRDASYISQINDAILNKVQLLQAQKTDLADAQGASQQQQKTLLVQRNTLAAKQTALVQTKQSKSRLLAETDAKESTYQQLLAQAKAELASFSAFSENAGGSGLLSNQTNCDSWGCYYNQRDTVWGNDPLNGTQYALKSDGCLVTAVAMVMTHYGYRDVTPVTINDNPANFAAYYPAYLLLTIYVDGKTVTRTTSAIDSVLATGNPVIVGIHAYGGTHFVVLVSGSKGNYQMRDPYIPNGDDISFTAHYPLSSIYAVDKVKIS